MIIECDRCYARYRYDEARFEDKPSRKVRCTKCLAIFEVFNTKAFESQSPAPGGRPGEETVFRLAENEGQTPRTDPTTKNSLAPSAGRQPSAAGLKMPSGFKVSLAVIAGPEAGRIFAVEKPRVVIGRHDADVNVDDPEISRAHAALELSGEKATLVDLGSTNGTFVGEEQIRECPLENQTEFSLGGSTLMLILTPRG
jgi:predicted Zn finger-like uncharacterized protein